MQRWGLIRIGMRMENELTSVLPAIWMVVAAFSFATMGALAHEIGSGCDWLTVAWVRIICTFVLAAGMASASGTRLVIWSPRTLWLRSVSGTVSLLCNFYALARLPVADVLALTNTYPLWIVVLSLRTRPRRELPGDVVCVACGVFGVALIQRPYLSGSWDSAVLICLIASLTTAVAMLGLHRLREVDPRAVVAHFSGLASLLLACWVLLHRPKAGVLGIAPGTTILLLGVGVSGTIGQVLLTKAFAAGPPARISVLSLTQVVFGMGYDIVLGGRVLSMEIIAGFLLVLAPSAWITLRAGGERPPADVPT